MLLTMSSLIVSYAQIGDSLTCYTNAELKKIAISVVYANECDSLLTVSEEQLSYKDSVISNLNLALNMKDAALLECEELTTVHYNLMEEMDKEIAIRDKQIVKQKRKLKWTKVGWAGTTVGLLALWLSAVLK